MSSSVSCSPSNYPVSHTPISDAASDSNEDNFHKTFSDEPRQDVAETTPPCSRLSDIGRRDAARQLSQSSYRRQSQKFTDATSTWSRCCQQKATAQKSCSEKVANCQVFVGSLCLSVNYLQYKSSQFTMKELFICELKIKTLIAYTFVN